MKLTRGGYDYDFLPLEVLLERCSVSGKKLICGDESFGALVIPGSEIISAQLLKKLQEFAAAGLIIFFTDYYPDRTENGAAAPAELAAFQLVDCDSLAAQLNKVAPSNTQFLPHNDDLRFYSFITADDRRGTLLLNSGRDDIKFAPVDKVNAVIYDPWQNKLFRLPSSGDITLGSQKLLALFYADGAMDLPEFPAVPEKLEVLPLLFNIYSRPAGATGEFTLLRKNSAAVNLNTAEKLTRYCGEFRYEAEFECTDPAATLLEIPHGGDAAELILNGQSCGISIGPKYRFAIAESLRPGKNTIVIHTWDNPAYADREGDKSIGYGSGYPLRPHGFTGEVKVG